MRKSKTKRLKLVGRQNDGFISKNINRKFSIPISKFILRNNLPISPNLISFFVLILGSLSAFFYLFNYLIMGGVFAQLCSIIDGCDGEIARARGKSIFGQVFDNLIDRTVETMIFLSIGITYYLRSEHVYIFIFALLLSFVNLFDHYTYRMILLENRKFYNKIRFTNSNIIVKINNFANKLKQRDFQIFLLFILSLFSLPALSLFIWLFTIIICDLFFIIQLQLSKQKNING